MGKTFKRNSQFRPKKSGRVFTKEPKKDKKHSKPFTLPSTDPYGPQNDFGIAGCDDFEKEG